jgi:integrase
LAKPLTDAACRKYAPGRERRRIRDGGMQSLFLIVEPSGHKSFQMRFRVGEQGRIAKLTLGPFDVSRHELQDEPKIEHIGAPLSLAAARLLAQKVLRERKLGRDPVADHKARKHRQRAETKEREASTFATAVRDYVKEYAKPQTRNWAETAKLLGLRYPQDGGEPEQIAGGLCEQWADKRLSEIDGHEVWSIIDDTRRHGVPGLAVRNRGLSEARARGLYVALSSLFSWLVSNRRIESNPCRNVDRPANAESRDRVLDNDEIRWFWAACDHVDQPRREDAPRPFAAILRLLLLTGARRDEVAGLRRDELRKDGEWNLPGARTKNGRAHLVPLAPAAREIIERAKGDDFIFSTNGRSQPSGWSKVKRRLDVAMLAMAKQERGANATILPWRIHDLRRSTVTGMVELGIRPDVVEAVVNHISGARAGVAGVYNKAQLLPERRAAMERWSAHLQGLLADKPANVVALAKRRRGK